MGYGYYPRYVSVAEKRARAEKKIKQLQKKHSDIQPVILKGQALATTWWGKSWNRNLERYADYTNRIGRGRSYVRHRAVVDLKIKAGQVDALVQGTRGAPYKVRIKIAKIKAKNWQAIKKKCLAELSSLPDLLAGKFPKNLQEVFMVQEQGLFPTPSEISFDCSCPDWADMCKHVAATLYGVGARLDEDPSLFFSLRKVNMEDLIGQAVQDKTNAILYTTPTIGKRVIADDKLSDLFDLDLDVGMPDPVAVEKPRNKRKAVARKKAGAGAKKIKTNAKKRAKKPENRKGTASAKSKKIVQEPHLPRGYGSAADLVFGCLQEGGEDGLSVGDLADITGIQAHQLYPILQRLIKKGWIYRLRRGVYCS